MSKKTKARLLIVDDSDDARIGLCHFFESEGFEIADAENGEEAIELLKKNTYDIVISDLKMQDVDGIDVLKAVRSSHPDTEVIIMTAYASVDTAVGALKLGAYDYISKPLNIDDVRRLVEKCIEKQGLTKEVSGLKQVIDLYEVSKGLGAVMDLDELLKLITELAADALGAEGGSIMLYEENTGELVARAATGRRSEIVKGHRVKLGERIAGYSARTGEDIKIEGSVTNDARFGKLDSYDGINSGLTVPLTSKNKLLGVINLHRSDLKPEFTDNDIKLLSIFGAQAAVAIENASLFDNLTREKDKLKTLFSEMSDGAMLLDPDLKVIMFNNAASELLGKDFENKDIKEITAGFISTVPLDDLRGASGPMNFELHREDANTIYISAALTRVKDAENKTSNSLLVLRNITAIKKEGMVKKNFLRLMSHKLRTPLTSIVGFCSLLTRKETLSKLDEQEKESIRVIESESDLLSSLVDRLLRFTLLESESITLTREKIHIDQVVDSVLLDLNPRLKSSGTTVTKNGLTELPALEADSDKIREVLENLIENAVKFNNTASGKKIEITGSLDGEHLKIGIKDNGPGIPPENLESVFDKFQQLEKNFTGQVDGMGLGLTLARCIIDAHGGKLWAESVEGAGSCFILALPRR